jgi:xylan 1,4-beta-xylosidase
LTFIKYIPLDNTNKEKKLKRQSSKLIMMKTNLLKWTAATFVAITVINFGNGQTPSFKSYMNPVIPGDHPDCTVSKIGNDFYTTGSSFNITPVIYHSTDLVHWEAIAQPVSASWADFGDSPGGGCWGGHIVYYKGQYWDYFSRANTMYFVTADKPEGPWSMPTKVNNPAQLSYTLGYDNSIFIDDDGKWYLVVKNGQPNGGIVELGNDGQPTGVVYDLNWLNPSPSYPYSWAEGPVMWKFKGYYYYSFARDLAGGQKVMRSKTLTADQSSWEMLGDFFNEKDPLKPGSRFASPNHSSNVVMIEDSTHWVIHPLYAKDEWKGQGRQGLLNQVRYDANDKPTADYPVNKSFTAPKLPSNGIPWMVPKSDFFNTEKLNPEWSLLGYTTGDKYSLTDRKGWLRLSPKSNKINTVTKNDGEHNYSLITRLEFDAKAINDEAGLIILRGDEKLFVKLCVSKNNTAHKVINFSFNNTNYESENTVGNTVWLKIIRVNHVVSGYFSGNGIDWKQVGQNFNVAVIDSYSDFVTFTGTRQGLYVQNSTACFDLYIYRDAYTPILAECPANQSGTIRSSAVQGISVLDSIHNNDWALYAGVEFGNKECGKAADSIQIIASSATSGGTVEVWLDSIETGNKIGECSISNTGGWSTLDTFSAKINQITGRHDIYLRFAGNPSGKLFQLKWIKFISKNAPHYISSYTTNDSTITVKFDNAINEPLLPTGFTVTLNGTENDSIVQAKLNSSNSSILNMILNKSIFNTDTIKISYKDGTVKTPDGLELITITDTLVENLLPGSAPRIIKAQTSLNGDSVIIRFNKKMKSPSGYVGEFKINTDQTENPIISTGLMDGDSSSFVINTQFKIYYENINTVDYSGTDIVSADNGLLKKVSSFPITNVSLDIPPIIKSATMRKTGKEYNVVVLFFDKPLADVSSQKDFFTFTINRQNATINTITGSYDSIRFSISPNIYYGDTVNVSYSGGNVASIHKGKLADFTDYLVPNSIVLIVTKKLYSVNPIKVYPDPLQKELNVISKDEFNVLSIYDLTGKLVLEKNYSVKIKTTTLSLNLAKGLYILKLKGKTSSSHSEIVVR